MEFYPTQSIITINEIKNVNLLSAIINDNDAVNILRLKGDYSGNVTLQSIQISRNNEIVEIDSNLTESLISMNGFDSLIIKDAQLNDNHYGSYLFEGSIGRDLICKNFQIINNTLTDSIIHIDGINSVTLSNFTVTKNIAINGLLLNGTGSGNIDIDDFVFEDNGEDLIIDGGVLISFNFFTDLDVNTCSLYNNNGDYLFRAFVSGDINFIYCNIYENDISDTLIFLDGDLNGNFEFVSSNIANNSDLQEMTINGIIMYVNDIDRVFLKAVVISNNFAANYLAFIGNYSGNFTFEE